MQFMWASPGFWGNLKPWTGMHCIGVHPGMPQGAARGSAWELHHALSGDRGKKNKEEVLLLITV